MDWHAFESGWESQEIATDWGRTMCVLAGQFAWACDACRVWGAEWTRAEARASPIRTWVRGRRFHRSRYGEWGQLRPTGPNAGDEGSRPGERGTAGGDE
jgi:hypothetical protein